VPSATNPADVAKEIARRDPAFRALIRRVGPAPRRRNAPVDERFAFLVRSITFQLLTTKAATTIHGRVHDLCGHSVDVDSVLKVGSDQLRTAGLSRTKAQAMVELAELVHEGRIHLARHGRMSDAEVVAEVTLVRGIGPWTAEMYLMHTLARPDVWPVGDFGVRSGWSLLHGDEEIISERDLREAGERFAGLRSSVAWYCWEAVHVHRGSN
jgi:DNA-3-methyladenine glycosylase II